MSAISSFALIYIIVPEMLPSFPLLSPFLSFVPCPYAAYVLAAPILNGLPVKGHVGVTGSHGSFREMKDIFVKLVTSKWFLSFFRFSPDGRRERSFKSITPLP